MKETWNDRTNRVASKIYGAAESASKDWFRRQCQDLYASMYLYYKPLIIAFWIGEQPLNDQWLLADSQRIPPSWTTEQVCRHICNLAKGLPILDQKD